MKSKYYLLPVILVSLLLFLSCNKLDSYFDINTNGNTSLRISKIKGKVPYGGNYDVAVFTYNSFGNPLKITRNLSGTGYPAIDFYYNNGKQMTDYKGKYNATTFEFWHKYYYDQYSRIVLDTTYIFGEDENGPSNYWAKSYSKYEYDGYNRVIKITTVEKTGLLNPGKLNDSTVRTSEFSYDTKGNKITGAVYDNRRNPHSTHNIWMFIDRDYSVNNPFTADSYNSKGFPIRISEATSFLGYYFDDFEFEYEPAK